MRIFCEICTELFDETKNAATTLCGHIFHENCLKEWLKYSHSCPKCRNPIEEATIIRLFFSALTNGAASNEYLENEVNNLKAVVHKKNLEIMRRKAAEIDIRNRVLDIKMRAARLEQRVNYIQLKHLKALLTTAHWCLSLKKAVDNLTIIKTSLERNAARRRQIEVKILNNIEDLEFPNVPPDYNQYSRDIRSRNWSAERMASKPFSSVILSDCYVLCNKCREGKASIFKDSTMIPVPGRLKTQASGGNTKYNRSYNPYRYIRSRNIFIQKDEELNRFSQTPETSSLDINFYNGVFSANPMTEDSRDANASAMGEN